MKNTKSLLIIFLISSITCFGQTVDEKRTIKVKKVSVDHTLVDGPAQFPGGQLAMHDFLLDNIKCLDSLQKDIIDGTVRLNIVVEKDGTVSNVKMLKGLIGLDCWNSEILRVFKIMPKWLPSIVNGVAVRTQFDSPVRIYMDLSPTYLGGLTAMNAFIDSVKIYPESLKYKGINGNSQVEFIVNKDGSMSDIKAVYAIPGCKACDEEAIRIVKLMTKWIPARINGKNVIGKETVWIHFKFSS